MFRYLAGISGAVSLGTQILAILIAVYGLFMTPLGWAWSGLVLGYALIWFLVNDGVKLLAYRVLDPIKAEGTRCQIYLKEKSHLARMYKNM